MLYRGLSNVVITCVRSLCLNEINLFNNSWSVIMMKRNIFRGKLSHFHCCRLHKLGSSHKKRICSHQSKFFPLRVDPILGRLCPPVKQRGSHKNCLPLKTWREKMEVHPYTLNIPLIWSSWDTWASLCENLPMQMPQCMFISTWCTCIVSQKCSLIKCYEYKLQRMPYLSTLSSTQSKTNLQIHCKILTLLHSERPNCTQFWPFWVQQG